MLNKKLVLALLMGAAPMGAMAGADGSCGVGTKIFDGQKGIAPQVLAMTTNGSTYNQLFGVTSGTLGCNPDAAVKSNWKMSMFIENNKAALARDMSSGSGETLDSLAALMGMKDADKAAFARVAQQNFTRIFPADDANTAKVMASLKQVLAADDTLAAYAAVI